MTIQNFRNQNDGGYTELSIFEARKTAVFHINDERMVLWALL